MSREGAWRRRKRWVVKVGGSLDDGAVLGALIPVLDRLSRRSALVIAPGGGAFADFIRDRSRAREAPEKTAHAQATLAVCQYGHELAGLLRKGAPVHNRAETMAALEAGATPVFIPYPFVANDPALPASWDATSDTIAARVCGHLQFGGLILLKSVDGVVKNGALQAEINGRALSRSGVVDPLFHRHVKSGWSVAIVNGRMPERLAELLTTGSTVMTRVRC